MKKEKKKEKRKDRKKKKSPVLKKERFDGMEWDGIG